MLHTWYYGHRICEIQTAPQSIKATFTGRHKVFQYTKVWILNRVVRSQHTQGEKVFNGKDPSHISSTVSKRLQCAILIKRQEIDHEDEHVHTLDSKPFHYCEEWFVINLVTQPVHIETQTNKDAWLLQVLHSTLW